MRTDRPKCGKKSVVWRFPLIKCNVTDCENTKDALFLALTHLLFLKSKFCAAGYLQIRLVLGTDLEAVYGVGKAKIPTRDFRQKCFPTVQ